MEAGNAVGLWALFVSAFTSATLLPGTSEVVLGLTLHQGVAAPLLLVGVATVGNFLGGVTTFALGWWAHGPTARFMRRPQDHPKTAAYLERYGPLSLFLSWVPVLGDGLVLLAGCLRYPPWPCALWMAGGKFLRYGCLALLMPGAPGT